MTDSSPAAGITTIKQRAWHACIDGLARRLPVMNLLPFAKFLSFATVGVLGTAAHYTVLGALVEFAGVAVLTGTTVGFVTGAIVNYLLNRRITFASDASHAVALPKFLTVAVLGAGLNWLIVDLLVHGAEIHYFIAQLAATATVLLWNFTGNHLWTFRE